MLVYLPPFPYLTATHLLIKSNKWVILNILKQTKFLFGK